MIPEGVTSISSSVQFDCKKVILPNSLENIEEGCFHQTVAYTGEYKNVVIVLYGVEIDFSTIFANFISSNWEQVARDSINDDNMIYDRQRMGDAAYEYYNSEEKVIIDNTIKEINSILTRRYCKFKYISYYALKPVIDYINENGEDKKAVAALENAEKRYLKDFDIEYGVLKHYSGTDSVIMIPSTVSTLDSIYKGRFDSYGNSTVKTIIIPNTVKRIGTQAFAKCRELKEIIIKITDADYISLCDMSFDGCTKLEKITVSDCVPDVWDLSGSGPHDRYYNGAPYSLKAIKYDGKYGVCEIDCSYKNARQKMKAVKSALSMLESKDFSVSLSPAVKNVFIAGYFVKTRDNKAGKYIKENIAKILPKKIKEGDIEFVKAVIEEEGFLDNETISKYIKTANTAKQAVIVEILRKKLSEIA